MLAQGGQIRNEQNKMATVRDEDENMYALLFVILIHVLL